LLAFEWLPGQLLMDLCTAPELDCDAVTAVGGALATLHGQDSTDLSSWSRAAEAADLLSLSSEIGFICPHLARRADELARRLAARLAGAPARHCALHGDFSANQVLVSQENVSIIDLDWACSGDPADDLGNFLAQAERFALRGELPRDRVGLLKESLLEGYARASGSSLPDRVELYTAVEVFRRTRFPFRGREPDWPQRTESLLERAGVILNQLDCQSASKSTSLKKRPMNRSATANPAKGSSQPTQTPPVRS
jgi:aminoglycoside phosphotransferase (APT) family kinase protein